VIVEFVYDKDCPNVPQARATLLRAFAAAGIPAKWTEWELSDAATPDRARGFGSPTVLVDGRDIAGVLPIEGLKCCRLYESADGLRSVSPPEGLIIQGLEQAMEKRAGTSSGLTGSSRATWKRGFWVVPGVGVSFLPKLACPACWPAYSAILSSVGLGWLISEAYLLPLTVVLLLMALAALAIDAKYRRSYLGLFLAMLGSPLIVIGKFILISDIASYGGVGLLIAASFLNLWHRPAAGNSCSSCVGGTGQ
jgi:hypothetical protein